MEYKNIRRKIIIQGEKPLLLEEGYVDTLSLERFRWLAGLSCTLSNYYDLKWDSLYTLDVLVAQLKKICMFFCNIG